MTNVHNTLYVTLPDAWVSLDGETLRVHVGDERRILVAQRLPVVAVHVGDVKMSGLSQSLERGWKLIRAKLSLGDPAPTGLSSSSGAVT